MNEKIVFVRTSSGEDEVRSRTAHLSKDIKRALLMVDGTATVAEIMKRSSPSLRSMLQDMLLELARGGFIRDQSKAPLKPIAPPSSLKQSSEVEELDFTAAYRAPTPAILAAEAAKLQAKQAALLESKPVTDEAISLEFFASPAMTSPAPAIAQAERERAAKAEVEAKAKLLAEERLKLEAEVSRLRSQAAAEAQARAAAEAQAKMEAGAAHAAKAEAERLALQVAQEEARIARVKAEQQAAHQAAEVKLREQVERQAREEIEAVRHAEQLAAQRKAESDAREAANQRAQLEAEVAALKVQAQSEAQARAAAEEQAKRDAAEASAERQAHEQAERVRRQAEQAWAEARLREQSEAQARAAAELQQAEQRKLENEARNRAVAEEHARLAEEVANLKAQAEIEAQKREQVRLEVDAARLKALEEAETARLIAQAAALQAQQESERLAAAQAERVRAERAAEQIRAEAEQARLRAVAETEARVQSERLAQAAETARLHAEQTAARIQAEAEARVVAAEAAALQVRQEAERAAREAEQAAQQKAQQEIARVTAELEAKARAEKEAERAQQQAEEERRKIAQSASKVREAVERAHHAAELRAHEETARLASEAAELLKAQQEEEKLLAEQAKQRRKSEASSNANMLAAIVRLNAKHASMEESVFAALDDLAQQESVLLAETAPSELAVASPMPTLGVAVSEKRTSIAAVAFFDVVGYSTQSNAKQVDLKNQFNQLISLSISTLGQGERVLLDTGDGIAIGFLQHPTDAMEMAMAFRNALMANKHADYPELRVRIGLHLGPVSLVKDVNGQINMLGDGINSSQRVMSFAGNDQIFASRAYFDFVLSLSNEYNDLFRYRGSHQDKHGREFQVYELLDAEGLIEEVIPTADRADQPVAHMTGGFAGFDLTAFDTESPPALSASTLPPAELTQSVEELIHRSSVADQLLQDAIGLREEEMIAPLQETVFVPVAPPLAMPVFVEPPVVEPVATVLPLIAPPEVMVAEADFSEDEARQLAEIQAKKWAEAEQRAAEQAQKVVMPVSPPVLQAAAAAEVATPVIHVKRKPLAWGRWLAGGVALSLAALFAIPVVLPMQGYANRIEQRLTQQFQQPVHIGHLTGRILPTPQWVLKDVTIGSLKVNQAQVNFAYSALLGSVKPIARLELDGLQLEGGTLLALSSWTQQLAADRQYPVAHIALSKSRLDADGLPFTDVDGQLDFDEAGKFKEARLGANGHKLAVEIRATPEKKTLLNLTLHDSALPWLPNWTFDELKANGELSRDELRITEMDGRMLGGVLTGDVRINWRSGWRAQGGLVGKVIPLQNLSKLLNGDMDGTARFQMQADTLSKLADAAILNGTFTVQKGVINGLDVVETTRLRSRESLPGGRTHFDELSGELNFANETYQFRQLKLSDNVVRASGSCTINKQQLSGMLAATLILRAGMGSANLQLGGTTGSPTLHVGN